VTLKNAISNQQDYISVLKHYVQTHVHFQNCHLYNCAHLHESVRIIAIRWSIKNTLSQWHCYSATQWHMSPVSHRNVVRLNHTESNTTAAADGQPIEHIISYKLLGLHVTYFKIEWTICVVIVRPHSVSIPSAQMCRNIIRRLTVLLPVAVTERTHASSLTHEQTKQLESIQRRAIKLVYGGNIDDVSWGLDSMPSLAEWRGWLTEQFSRACWTRHDLVPAMHNSDVTCKLRDAKQYIPYPGFELNFTQNQWTKPLLIRIAPVGTRQFPKNFLQSHFLGWKRFFWNNILIGNSINVCRRFILWNNIFALDDTFKYSKTIVHVCAFCINT